MSTSSTYVKWAAVTLDFAIFSKMRFLSPWIGIRCSLPPGATATAGGGATTVVLAGPCAALRTSSSLRRPCGPLPRIAARFTLSSFARRRTAGAARISPVGLGAGGASVLAGAGVGELELAGHRLLSRCLRRKPRGHLNILHVPPRTRLPEMRMIL